MCRSLLLAATLVVGTLSLPGCTTVGVMPGMTMSSPVPERRGGTEVQFAGVPTYFLSDAAQSASFGTMAPQVAGWLDLGELIAPVDGLGVGFRWVGDVYEPMLRYRFWLDQDRRFSLGVVGFVSYAESADSGAYADYWRGGLEVSTDIRLTPVNRWAELHLQAGLGVTGLRAHGAYCQGADGLGVDCPESGEPADRVIASLAGGYPTGSVGLSLDLFRGVPVLHVVRASGVFAGGSLPQLRRGEQVDAAGWYSFGFNVEVGIGDW